MKEKFREIAEYAPPDGGITKGIGDKSEKKESWGFDTLDRDHVFANIPIMAGSKGMHNRIQLPIHDSTEILATKIREKHYTLFRINLDVYKTMLYIGRQVLEWLLLGQDTQILKSKTYQLAMVKDKLEKASFYENCLEDILQKLLDGYLSHGTGEFSRDNILGQIDEIRPHLSQTMLDRVDQWIEDELDSEITQSRVKEKLRKRKQREVKKNLRVMEGGKG